MAVNFRVTPSMVCCHILKDLAEVLNNTKKLSTGVYKEEEFEACKGGVEMACFVFGAS